jgi:thymidylate synthase
VACNNKTCYSLFQVYNGKLSVYIRSNDFSLGFMNDLYFMCQFAKLFNKKHPNTAITTIRVNWGSLHVYSNNWSQTKEWLTTKTKKGLKFNFN